MNTYYEALLRVNDKLNINFQRSNTDNKEKVNDFICLITLLQQIYEVIKDNESKAVLQEAQCDLLSSLIFCFQAYYRQANICLRSSIELVLSFLYYYDNQYDFILWKNDCIDMTWTQLVNKDKGVFNEKFLSIINGNNIKMDCCLEKIKELYHLTSQYVHGKYDYMQKELNDKIEYSEKLVNDYFDISEKILKIQILMLYIRFRKEIDENIDPDEVNKIKILARKYEVIKYE